MQTSLERNLVDDKLIQAVDSHLRQQLKQAPAKYAIQLLWVWNDGGQVLRLPSAKNSTSGRVLVL